MNTSSSGSPSSSQGRSDTYQRRVDEWVIACFGDAIRGDKVERNHRFLEESLELVQACGCVASEAHQLVDYVFGRAVGEPGQEVGGVMNTLAALCNINDLDMMAEGDVELTRCWAKIEKIRAKQAAKPKHSPLPGPSESSPGVGAKSDQGKDTRDEQTASLLSRLKEAADALQAAEARIKVLEGALAPFVERLGDTFPDDADNSAITIRVKYLRAARSALPQLGGENG